MFYIVWVFSSYIILIAILTYMKSHSKTVWLVHEYRREVAMGATQTHTLTAKDWSSLALKVVTNPTVILLQAGNIVTAIFWVCFRLMMMAPALVFWFAVYLFVWEPDTFNTITVNDIKSGLTNGGPMLYVLFYVACIIVGVLFLVGKISLIGLRNYIEAYFYRAVKGHLSISEESVIYLRKTKARIKVV